MRPEGRPRGCVRPGQARARLRAHRDAHPPELRHPARRLAPHQFADVLREPAQHPQAAFRRLRRRPLRRTQHLAHALRGPVELECPQPPLHRLRRRHVPHPPGGHPEEAVPGHARRAQQQCEIRPRHRPVDDPGEVEQRQHRPAHAARRRPGPQQPRPAPLADPVREVPGDGVQGPALHPQIQLVQPFGRLAPVPLRKRPPGEVGRPGPYGPLAPAAAVRTLRLRSRLTHPALPPEPTGGRPARGPCTVHARPKHRAPRAHRPFLPPMGGR